MINIFSYPARWKARLAGHIFVIGFVSIWSLYSSLVESYVMPAPWTVLSRFGYMFLDVYEIGHMLYSFFHIISAVFISFIIGCCCAFAAFYIPVFERMVHGRLSPFLNSFSGIGWTFLAIIWFGISDITVIFVISMVLIPFAIINLREALLNLDFERLEMSISFTRSKWRRFWLIILPSLYPFVFATIRISFGVAWKVALTAELFGGNTGLGYMLNLARQDFDMPLVIAIIIVIIAFVYSTDRWVFVPIQSYLARHHGTA